MAREVLGSLLERVRRACRQGQDVPEVTRLRGTRHRSLLQHDMRIGSADSERADTRAAQLLAGRPFCTAGVHMKQRCREIDLRIRFDEIQAWRGIAALDG